MTQCDYYTAQGCDLIKQILSVVCMQSVQSLNVALPVIHTYFKHTFVPRSGKNYIEIHYKHLKLSDNSNKFQLV